MGVYTVCGSDGDKPSFLRHVAEVQGGGTVPSTEGDCPQSNGLAAVTTRLRLERFMQTTKAQTFDIR